MNTQEVIKLAKEHLQGLSGHCFDVLEVAKPVTPNAAVNLSKVVSKLSPLVGNLIEFNTCEYLNGKPEFKEWGTWIRQDPGFPDTIFQGRVEPTPGFEIKAWFPLATEITARFKDSQSHFLADQTYVAQVAWLPEHIIFGQPKIIDILVVSGRSVAEARDSHYHNPPDYLVLEPENTATRTRNLQQTNTNGYGWQPSDDAAIDAQNRADALALIQSWGPDGKAYSLDPEYQVKLRQLMGRFKYRLDTNFAKMNRIRHAEINAFKARVYGAVVHGKTILEWNRLLSGGNDDEIKLALAEHLDIRNAPEALVE